jgi:hypothetical protein
MAGAARKAKGVFHGNQRNRCAFSALRAMGIPCVHPNPFRFCGGDKEKQMAHALTYMTNPESWKSWTSRKKLPYQGVVKRDWVPTGRIDFATQLDGDGAEADQPSEFKLLVEERRIVESIAGNENLEIQWRLATLREAKAVVTQYHKYLSENSLIKTVFDETVSLAPSKKVHANPST